MKVLIDTNVIIDCLSMREPFFELSKEVLRECTDGETVGYIATHTANDIFYIVKRIKPELPKDEIVKAIVMFVKILETVNLTATDVESASLLKFSDFEDALVSQCAAKIKADYIVTRNTEDFSNSPVKALTPETFLKIVNRS